MSSLPRAEDLLVRLAAQAVVLLANAQATRPRSRCPRGSGRRLRTRDLIGTAKGILMARDGADEETAFAMLVGVSQRSNTKLRDVAQGIVTATVRRTG